MVRLVLTEGGAMLGRLIVGLFCLFLLTIVVAVFGLWGFLFMMGLGLVVFWAVAGNS